MRTELEQKARAVCFEHLSMSPFKPWLFEYTPAAAESASEAYLAGVETSDLVIWLVASETSAAVQRELQHALDRQKEFLVLCLPVTERDGATTVWLTRLRDVVKTKTIANLEDLGPELDAALDDFLVSSVRTRRLGPVAEVARLQELATLEERVRAIAMTGWMAVGVTTEKARELASDVTVGALEPIALPNQDEPLRVIQAPVGAGKTLAAVRFIQRAIVHANSDQSASTPVWIEARDGPALDREVATALERAGRTRSSPITMVVDGLDETSAGNASLILEHARLIAFSRGANRVLLTSRPTGIDTRGSEISSTPQLTVPQSIALIKRVFDVELSDYRLYGLPASIRTALARPLFSLLLGRRVASGAVGSFAIGDLIATLVTDGIGQAAADELSTNRGLASLALASLDRGTQTVDPRLLGSRIDVRTLLETRLVTESGDGVSFSLPILREWFGGIALQLGLVGANELVASPSRLERWRYALFMGLATLPPPSVDALMATLARALPGFASEAMAASAWQADVGTPSCIEIGERLYRATRSLSAGLGPIETLIGPRVGAEYATLGVGVEGNSLTYAWARSSTTPAVVSLPQGFSFLSAQEPDWHRRRYRGTVSGDPLWVWRAARDDLRDGLQAALKQRVLFPEVPQMREEAAWRAALELQPIGEHFYGPLDVNHIRERLEQLGDAELLETRRGLLPLHPLRDLISRNPDRLLSPYAIPDANRDSWIWSGFSDAALLARTRAVYTAAIAIYEAFVRFFLPAFAPSLLLHYLLPARLYGILRPVGRGGGMEAAPGLTYVIEPLASGSQTEISIELADDASSDNDWGWRELERNAEAILRRRPDAPPWLSATAHTTVLEVFGADPATRLAESWLVEDLHRIGWAERRWLR